MNNEHNPLSFITTVAKWIFDTIGSTLVELFDGAKKAIDHANPSLFALVATLLPFALPLPVAFMTATSAMKFFGWQPWAAYTLGIGLEGLGLLSWVRLVDVILEWQHTENKKISASLALYGAVCLAYEVLLVFLNSILAFRAGADTDYVIVLTLVCLLPALSATIYGANKSHVEAQLAIEKQEQKDLAEKIRQEQRADRKEARELKLKYASQTEAPKEGKKFRPS